MYRSVFKRKNHVVGELVKVEQRMSLLRREAGLARCLLLHVLAISSGVWSELEVGSTWCSKMLLLVMVKLPTLCVAHVLGESVGVEGDSRPQFWSGYSPRFIICG
ncbi:hypothetical protein KIL84_004845 [Mauremys mutica]|uniref:Uncharacterized protein n=1 Tax=Mauremys mutica TaxID=74926 RepID=A0A9D3XQ77_9SAUR|nr:hypothetical protein KIL84_004845 [Mauremys mutica]